MNLAEAVRRGDAPAVRSFLERENAVSDIDAASLQVAEDSGHWEVFDALTDAGMDGIAALRPVLEAMESEIMAARPIYRPSSYWSHFNRLHLEQLRRGGMGRFKRSINQYYFNFLPYTPFDPKIRSLARWWLLHPTATPFTARLVDPDLYATGEKVSRSRGVFTMMSRRGALGAVGHRMQLLMYRVMVTMLWDYARRHDPMGILGRLEEPRLGAPIEVVHDGHLVSQDLAHSALECNAIFDGLSKGADPWRISEVGAGYGRLGHVLLEALECRYFVFDIPPGLAVSQWYLSRLFPGKRVFRFRRFTSFDRIREELLASDIAFFTPNQIELFPEDFFDVSINISSLHEMQKAQIENLLGHMYRTTSRYVYLKQYKEARNPHDGIVITEDCYPLGPGWRHRYYRASPVDPRFFETLIESTGAS